MFIHQTKQYTITADEMQWVLTWHPGGPKYTTSKGIVSKTPSGSKTYFNSLLPLTVSLLDRKARNCSGIEELRDSLKGFVAEMREINLLEISKKEVKSG